MSDEALEATRRALDALPQVDGLVDFMRSGDLPKDEWLRVSFNAKIKQDGTVLLDGVLVRKLPDQASGN